MIIHWQLDFPGVRKLADDTIGNTHTMDEDDEPHDISFVVKNGQGE